MVNKPRLTDKILRDLQGALMYAQADQEGAVEGDPILEYDFDSADRWVARMIKVRKAAKEARS